MDLTKSIRKIFASRSACFIVIAFYVLVILFSGMFDSQFELVERLVVRFYFISSLFLGATLVEIKRIGKEINLHNSRLNNK
ncbi:MAG: hypothetical protein ACK5KQ_00235 [Anaerorhabdus sp.]